MKNNKSLFTPKEYNKISLNLKDIMKSRKISRNKLAGAVGTRFEVINKWYQGDIERIDLDILARICHVLDCTPADLLKADSSKKPKGDLIKNMKLAVIGSRTINNINLSKYIPFHTKVIITGGAEGVDHLAEEYADKHKISKRIIKPEYDKYGRKAPILRNKTIVDEADLVLAIWDGESKGTKFTIDYAEKLGKPLRVVRLQAKNT